MVVRREADWGVRGGLFQSVRSANTHHYDTTKRENDRPDADLQINATGGVGWTLAQCTHRRPQGRVVGGAKERVYVSAPQAINTVFYSGAIPP